MKKKGIQRFNRSGFFKRSYLPRECARMCVHMGGGGAEGA